MTELESLNIGFELHRSGDLAAAEKIYRSILASNPASGDALYLLGMLESQRGNEATSAELLAKAAAIFPERREILLNLGRVQANLRQLDQAKQTLHAAMAIASDDPDVLANLARVHCLLNDFSIAVGFYRRAIELNPNHPTYQSQLGAALQQLGDYDSAIEHFQQALDLDPNLAETCLNLAIAYQSQRQFGSAIQAYLRAIELKPNFAEAFNNLATVYQEIEWNDQAVAAFRKAIAIESGLAVTHKNLGNALRDLERLDEAEKAYAAAFNLNPEFTEAALLLLQVRQQMCDWTDRDSLATRTIESVERDEDFAENDFVPPFSFITLPVPTSPAQQLQGARKWSKQKYGKLSRTGKVFCFDERRRRNDKIKIGYLSSDFHQHATAWLIVELIEAHDRNAFDIVGYSYGPDDQSPIRERLKAAFNPFRDVQKFSDRQIAEQIYSDQIDILVDLKGHTRGGRTEILAHRPAPHQIHFLGYPGTMGTDFVDYIVVDEFVVPADQQRFFTEKLLYVPGCYQVNDSRQEISPIVPTRTECGLPESGFVFCSFNSSYKITTEIFDVWMRILDSTPGSVLWLLETNPWSVTNLRREAQRRQVDETRLVFAPKQSNAEHLARQKLADLFLDTYPVNAHTTASDALRMGLPIVTLAGESFISRVAGSLLTTLDLPELITSSYADYESTILRLTHTPRLLREIREKLSASLSKTTLYDGRAFAKKLEAAFRSLISFDK